MTCCSSELRVRPGGQPPQERERLERHGRVERRARRQHRLVQLEERAVRVWGELVGLFWKLPAFLKLTNTYPFAVCFVVTGDATPGGICVVRSVLGAISPLAIVRVYSFVFRAPRTRGAPRPSAAPTRPA